MKYDIRVDGKTVESYDKFMIAYKRKNTLQKENKDKTVILVKDYGG